MKKVLWFILILFGTGTIGVFVAGYSLCKPNNHLVPALPGTEFKRIEILSENKRVTVAWVADGINGKGVILAHGNSSDRNSMVPRMRYFHSMGYAVIAPDLNGHGETIGNRKTFGFRESKDIESANRYLRLELGIKWIGALGTSLGGASILKAESDGSEFNAIIIESVFSDIRVAASNRLEMKFGKFGKYMEPILTAQIPLWLGFSRDKLRPKIWAQKCHVPILILTGDADERARPWESAEIFAQAATRLKKIHIFKGAKHEDLFAFNQSEYDQEINQFIKNIESDSASIK